MKTCPTCGKELVRHDGELAHNWRKRRFCSVSCAVSKHSRGVPRRKAMVPCKACGVLVERGAHQKNARCLPCVRKNQRLFCTRHRRKMADQARRYRILMTALGWADFDELMAYLREVPWACVGDQRVKDLRGAA